MVGIGPYFHGFMVDHVQVYMMEPFLFHISYPHKIKISKDLDRNILKKVWYLSLLYVGCRPVNVEKWTLLQTPKLLEMFMYKLNKLFTACEQHGMAPRAAFYKN